MIRSIVMRHLSDAGVSVSPEIAMRFSTVYACVRLLSDTIAQMPCKLYSTDISGDRNPSMGDPLYNVLSISPENGLTAYDFWKKSIEQFLLRGYFVARTIKNTTGEIIRLIPVNNVTKIERDVFGRYVFTYRTQQGEQLELKQQDAFFSFFSVNEDMIPISPIEVNRNTVGLAIAAEKHGCNVFKSGGTPAGTLEYPGKLDQKIAAAIKEAWDKAYGVNGVGGVAILEGGAKFGKVSMSNEDAQYLQTRQFQKTDICGIFGVPPHMISDTAQAKGWSTMEQMMIEFVTLTINPITIRLEQSIKKCLIPSKKWNSDFAKFATNGLLRGDTGARTAYYAGGLDRGYLEINEVRRLEDMNALDDSKIKEFQASKKSAPPIPTPKPQEQAA
jgi:HK97 family phage portal protein